MLITSRVGRKPVAIPAGVVVNIEAGSVSIKGPKGTLNIPVDTNIELQLADGKLQVKSSQNKSYIRSGSGKKLIKSIPGTIRSQINNAVQGVTVGFQKRLVLVGVGYRAQMKGKYLSLAIGYSIPMEYHPEAGVTIETPSQTEIIVKGACKRSVGEAVAKIMAIRPPEPYKGKGIIDPTKPIDRKETKKK